MQSFHPEHAHLCLEASLPLKVKTRNTQSRLESGMRHGIPYTNVLSSASSWEFSVFVRLAAHIHSTCSCVTPSNRKWCLSYSYVMWSVYRWEKTFGSPQTFTLSIFLSLAIKLRWSWKVEGGGGSKKQVVIKVWAEGIEEQTRCHSPIHIQDNYFAIPFKTPFAFCF